MKIGCELERSLERLRCSGEVGVDGRGYACVLTAFVDSGYRVSERHARR